MITTNAIAAAAGTNLLVARRDPWLNDLLDRAEACGGYAVVGGAVRDWLFGRVPRDIDVCVQASPADFAALVAGTPDVVRRTSRGGHRFQHEGTTVDLWRLQDSATLTGRARTWRELVRHTFLNVDGVCVTGAGAVHQHGFAAAFDDRELRINHSPNPSPRKCAVRAVVFARRYGLRPNFGLMRYVHGLQSEGFGWEEFDALRAARYPNEVVRRAQLEAFCAGAVP